MEAYQDLLRGVLQDRERHEDRLWQWWERSLNFADFQRALEEEEPEEEEEGRRRLCNRIKVLDFVLKAVDQNNRLQRPQDSAGFRRTSLPREERRQGNLRHEQLSLPKSSASFCFLIYTPHLTCCG
jgi:hypothetical protein